MHADLASAKPPQFGFTEEALPELHYVVCLLGASGDGGGVH